MRTLRIVLVVSAALTTAAVAATTFTPLSGRAGLWQTTVQMSGSPIPAAVLARLPEAQRAKMIADAQKPITMKQCITAEQLQKGFDPAQTRETKCTRTVMASSAAGFTMHMECTTARGGSFGGTFTLAFVDGTHYRGTSEMVMNTAGSTSTIKSTVSGQWFGADCGSVKPNMPQ